MYMDATLKYGCYLLFDRFDLYLPGNMDDIQPGLGQCTAKIRWSADPIKAQAQNLQHPSSLELKRSKKSYFHF